MKNRRFVLIILIIVLVLFYAYMCIDLLQDDANLPLSKQMVIRRMSYTIVWGVLLTAISYFLQERKRVLKKILKFAGLWCMVIASLIILIVLSGAIQLQ